MMQQHSIFLSILVLVIMIFFCMLLKLALGRHTAGTISASFATNEFHMINVFRNCKIFTKLVYLEADL